MKAWWHNLSLHNKLQIPLQLSLLLMLVLAQIWVTREFNHKLFEDAEQRAISSATQSFLGLNAMMLNGIIREPSARLTYFKKMEGQDGVIDFHVARGQPVVHQFGAGLVEEQARDEFDLQALNSNLIQKIPSAGQQPSLRVVVPFAARRDFHGTDCLQCHSVKEGQVNGAISLTISLEREYAELNKVRIALSAGQLALQILLFFLLRFLIWRAIHSVVELEKTMHEIEADGDLSKRAKIESGDEVGHIAKVFNDFMYRVAELKQQLADKVAVLEKYHARNEEQQRVGGFIMARMTQLPDQLGGVLHRHMRPVEHLGGDILIAATTPSGVIHILLADAIGHGLSAAVNVLPLCQTFYDQTGKGFSIGQIAQDLNAIVGHFMPTDRFVSASLVSINTSSQTIEVWNGGIPSILLVNQTGKVLHRWVSENLPLGVAAEGDFSAKPEVFHYSEPGQLCLFSDGVIEAMSPQGEIFGEDRLIGILTKSAPSSRLRSLLEGLDLHLAGRPAHDDISLALMDVGPDAIAEARGVQVRPVSVRTIDGHWGISVTLSAKELRYLDVVPLLLQITAKIETTQDCNSALFMILSELFNNALDHGLLKLDSALKHGPDGFDTYLELRDERLKALQVGIIEVELKSVETEGRQAVRIRVVDSGEGFDYATLIGAAMGEFSEMPYGRGIALVKSVAYKLEYQGSGNEVIALYICN